MADHEPEELPQLTETRNTAIVKGGIRSLIAGVPAVGGVVAQAWTEYETYTQNARVEEFAEQLARRLSTVEQQVTDLAAKVKALPDLAELFEEFVEGVKRETQAEKRSWHVNALLYFMLNPTDTTRDERRSIIQDLQILTVQDFNYLCQFSQGVLRGDFLSGSGLYGYSPSQAGAAAEKKWEQILGPAINSLAKLESRGLIVETALNASFSWSGDADAWYNRFRRKAWRLTPIGAKVLAAIQT